jgi:multidrug efflux system outer membrane protein
MKSVIATGALVATLGAAPQPLTFADTIRRVTTEGFDYRIALAMASAADADARGKLGPTRPSIGVSATAIDWNEPQLGSPISKQLYVLAKASIPLVVPAAASAARAAALTAIGAGTTGDAGNARDDAALVAARAYRRAQLAQAILDVRHVAVDDQREHVRRTDQQIAAGKLPRYVGSRDRAQAALAEQAEEDAAAERDEALTDLAALLVMPLDSPIAISEPLMPFDVTGERDTFLKRADIQRADILAAVARRRAAEASVTAARFAFSPVLSFNAESYNGTSAPNVGRAGGLASLNASVPIVDGGSRRADIAKATAELEQTRIAESRTRLYAQRDVADAWRELVAARANIASAGAALRNSREQLRIARLRERAGKAIDLEILDALSLAASAREGQARAIARLDVAASVLRRTAAEPQI